MRASNEDRPSVRVTRAQEPQQAVPSFFLFFPPLPPRGVAKVPRYCAHPTFYLESGLDGVPLRVSNKGLLRPRVARAQETI
jgi:hypothetical protein